MLDKQRVLPKPWEGHRAFWGKGSPKEFAGERRTGPLRDKPPVASGRVSPCHRLIYLWTPGRRHDKGSLHCGAATTKPVPHLPKHEARVTCKTAWHPFGKILRSYGCWCAAGGRCRRKNMVK